MFPSGLKLRLSGEPGIPSKNISVVPEKKKGLNESLKNQ
jgi:hypothetical protein